jgi:hypothetical protein
MAASFGFSVGTRGVYTPTEKLKINFKKVVQTRKIRNGFFTT